MTPLRGLTVALAGAVLVAALVLPRPGSFLLTGPGGLVLFVLVAGSVAADAVPFRRRAFLCSLLSLPAALLVPAAQLGPLGSPAVGAAAVLALQLVAWRSVRGASGTLSTR